MLCSRPGRCSGPSTQAAGENRDVFFRLPMQRKLREESAAAATHQTLVAVAAGHVSLAGAVAADLVAGSPQHDDAARVAVARCCQNKREKSCCRSAWQEVAEKR